MANLADLTITGNGKITLPKGTTAERPASPSVGMTRYNTEFDVVEYYTANGWASEYGKYDSRPAFNALEIHTNFPGNKSGYYFIRGYNNNLWYAYCDMTGKSAQSSVGGWMMITELTVVEHAWLNDLGSLSPMQIDFRNMNVYYTGQTYRTVTVDSRLSGFRLDLGSRIKFSGFKVTWARLGQAGNPDGGNVNDTTATTPTNTQILNFYNSDQVVGGGSNATSFGFAASNGTDVVRIYNGVAGTAAGEWPVETTSPIILTTRSFPTAAENNLPQGNGRYIYWYWSDAPTEYYALNEFIMWVR